MLYLRIVLLGTQYTPFPENNAARWAGGEVVDVVLVKANNR